MIGQRLFVSIILSDTVFRRMLKGIRKEGKNVGKELYIVKNKIQKLKAKKALIDEQLEPLFIREEELENEEIVAICRKNNITISDLMAKVNKQKAEMKKEKTNENQFEKE